MQVINNASPSINHGAALLAAPIPMKKSSGNDMLKEEFEMILTQSRDDDADRHECLVDIDKDVAAETPAKAALIKNDSEGLQKEEERDVGDMWDENQQPLKVELAMMAPPALSRSGSAMSHASCKPSNSFQEEVQEKKAPVALYRSRTDVSQDKKSLPASPVSLSRSRTATPQISNERSAPSFSDMMKLVALSRARSFQLNKLPKVAQPESIEEVATIEEVPSVEALSVASHQISNASTTSSADVPADEEAPAADFATAVEAPAANEEEEDEEFAAVEVVEVVEVELEPEDKFAEVVLLEPEDKFAEVILESKSSFKKSKLSKMKGLFTKKSQKEQN